MKYKTKWCNLNKDLEDQRGKILTLYKRATQIV